MPKKRTGAHPKAGNTAMPNDEPKCAAETPPPADETPQLPADVEAEQPDGAVPGSDSADSVKPGETQSGDA